MSKFTLKLFEVVTEEHREDGSSLADDAFIQFLREIRNKKAKVDFLPVQKEILSQFGASLILHLPPKDALPTVIECYEKYDLEPCFYHSYYEPEAQSESIKSRQQPVQVIYALIKALMTSPDHLGLAWQKLNHFSDDILKNIEKNLTILQVFKLARRLLDLLLSVNTEQCFDKAFSMAKIFQFMYNLYFDIDIHDKDGVFHAMFNKVILELLKNLAQNDERLSALVIPFVDAYASLGLNPNSIRGLVHKLEENSEIVKYFYDLGVTSQVYPFHDMDVENNIVVQSYYSHFEMSVIFKEVFKSILTAISEQEVTRLFKALREAITEQETKETGIERISYRIRIEKLSCPDKTDLYFLDRFNLLNLNQASERVSQVLSSNNRAKITLDRKDVTKDETGTLTLDINSVSLIRYLYLEHIHDDEKEVAEEEEAEAAIF